MIFSSLGVRGAVFNWHFSHVFSAASQETRPSVCSGISPEWMIEALTNTRAGMPKYVIMRDSRDFVRLIAIFFGSVIWIVAVDDLEFTPFCGILNR